VTASAHKDVSGGQEEKKERERGVYHFAGHSSGMGVAAAATQDRR
jgi:hypothetical protein